MSERKPFVVPLYFDFFFFNTAVTQTHHFYIVVLFTFIRRVDDFADWFSLLFSDACGSCFLVIDNSFFFLFQYVLYLKLKPFMFMVVNVQNQHYI